MGYSVEVNSSNFDSEVIEPSYTKPVLIDFFATWCGPCQLLKPVLEKLAREYDFILAKVDIDKNQDLANRYGIEGVPDVRIALKGEVYPGFVGALSEAQLRDLLDRLNLKSELDLGLEKAKDAIASQDFRGAKQIFDNLLAQYSENPRVAIEAARFLLRIGQLQDAERIAQTIGEDNRAFYPKAQAIQTLIQLKQAADNPGDSELDRLFASAARLALSEDYEGAFQLLLQIVQENRQYRNDGARKAMVSLFNLLGLDHPLTKQYQQELMMALY
ncbi:co-chaperone YbbN [Hydrococcus rivularis NIES-593]|uniref:Co-chaperone YbbN n=1 Tax=Hydrococcus rivularis NIES-593 TaxID=1921803 RepID=A0A1U7HRE6_9CYAN|nr:tetratricopeptide repeat protein [Hydrococcus rivularis]OKH26166.1 co-chaperone YbbN [Hydrococcus rivularis NIES-593]